MILKKGEGLYVPFGVLVLWTHIPKNLDNKFGAKRSPTMGKIAL